MAQFLLGLASGIAVLTITAYRRVSPRWLKWLLIATGLLFVSRYVALTFSRRDTVWWWMVSGVGLTFPGVFAVDQLVRHPAMTPKKLLQWYAPFVMAYVVSLLCPGRHWTAPILIGLFALAFLGICVMLARRLPDRRIRTALLGLSLAYVALGFAGLVFPPALLLCVEMSTLLALWYGFETSASL